MTVFIARTDLLPTKVREFCEAHAEEISAGTLGRCACGAKEQPLTIFASAAPSVAFCDKHMRDEAVRNRYNAVHGRGLVACDLCQLPEQSLSPFTIALGHFLILGVGCDRCLEVEVARGRR
jgi:hypothetical protein